MKVLHKAKQILQGFVLPRGSFSPRSFLPNRGSKDQSKGGRIIQLAKRVAPLALGTGVVLSLVMNFGVPQAPANASNCHVGSSAACPATSPQEIFNLYGTSANTVYWLNVGGTPREVFVVMDTSSSWGGGYWILLMKGTRGTSNFGYSSTYFTSNTSVLNEASPSNNISSDAKYHAYNSTPLSEMLAVISSPANGSIPIGGDIANNSFGGHTWLESAGGNTAFSRLTTTAWLNVPNNSNAFSAVPRQKFRQTNSDSSTQVFSYQSGTGIYGHNVNCGTGYKVRWGILWNNETQDTGSCDAFVGIGGAQGSTELSPRDWVTYLDGLTYTPTGISRSSTPTGLGQFAFQIWGKMATPSQTAPAQPTVVNAALDAVTVSWTAPVGSPTNYVVQYKLTSDSSWGTNPSQSVVVSSGTSTTITGLSNSTSYDFRVMARTSTNSSSPSPVRTHTITPRTISFNSNGGTGTMATINVADSVSTTIPANSFTRDRHTFRGWNTAANGTGTSYNSGDGLSAAGANVTLFAMWTSLDDMAWNKTTLENNYASANLQVIPSTGGWTFETWIRPNSDGAGGITNDSAYGGIFSQQTDSDTGGNRVGLWVWDKGLRFGHGGTTDVATTYNLTSSRWYHIAMSYNGSVIKIFVDGTEVHSQNLTVGTMGQNFVIGGLRQTNYREWEGQIDQVKVWGQALDANQLSRSMHEYSSWTGTSASPTGTCAQGTGLRALYDFNEFNTGVVLDRSGCNRHLPFNSAVTGSYSSSNFDSSSIIETSTAFNSLQNVVKFNRSYLTAAGGWTRPAQFTNFKAVVVAGGGGGGAWVGGGGGAGGLIQSQRLSITDSVIRVEVGQGGRGAQWGVANNIATYSQLASSGQNSSLGSAATAMGGGYGGSHRPGTSGDNWITVARAKPAVGGSGGGGSGKHNGSGDWTTIATGALGTAGQGNKGGSGTSASWQAAGGGGAGEAGSPGITGFAGAGGAGLSVNITGTPVTLAGGGGGSNHDVPTDTAAGGSGGGGRGGNLHGLDGSANTGGGGGGGSNNSGNGNTSSGGDGGSGVVILSYGSIMDVTQNPGGARAGSVFQRPITIQLKNSDGTNYTGANQQVTLTAATGSILQQTIGGVTTNITSTTTTSRDGVATFSNIGFQSGVGSSAQTLTVTADAFVGTSLSVTPTFVATSISITSSGTTAGQFIDGVFQANGASATNIRADDLVSAMTSRNVTIESSGNIAVSTGLTSSSINNLTLTCAGSGVFTNLSGAISLASDLTVSCATVTTSATITTSGTGGVSLTSLTGAITVGAAISGATDLLLESASTTALNANLTAGSQGISVKSVGRITTSAGNDASSSPRLIGTAGGPITFWTTGAAGGVTLGNFTQLNTTQSSAAGADITIGGGTAMTADASRPSGPAASNVEHGIQLGTTVNSSVFVVRAGTGEFSASGSYTGTASTAKAGIWFPPGQDINAGTITLEGATTYNQANDSSAGIDAYFSGSSATSLIHATRNFAVSGDAVRITGSSASNTGMQLGPNFNNPNPMTIRASGQNAGISITGTSSSGSASSGLWVAGLQFQTANGPVSLNSGARPIGLSSANRTSSYAPISPATGGNIRIVAGGIHSSSSSAAFNVNTAGSLTFEPFSTSFDSAVTFPATASTTTVGSLVVGSASNVQTVTVGSNITSSGNVTYRAGTFENTGSITSNNGDVLLEADNMTLSTSVNIAAPNGNVTLAPQSNSRVIDLGTNVIGRLSLTDAELDRISATTLRIGAPGGANTGNIEISAAISPALTPTLALRTGGSGTVSSTGSNSITETNLGIQAGGTINLAANNSISGNLALNSPASALTYSQTSGNFTPTSVDGISAEYGVPSSLTLSRVPTTQTENRTLGEVFSLTPEATLRDEFSNPLLATNAIASSFSITVTRASGSGTLSGTLVRATTAGVASFDNLRITTNPGAHTLTFTATASSGSVPIIGTPAATTGTYNIRSTQAITFTQMTNRTMGGTNEFTVAATSSSGLSVSFTSDTTPVCTTSGTNGTTVTMVTAGTCRINANQIGDSAFAPATQVQQSFTVSRALELTTPASGLSGTFNSAYTLTLARAGGASPYTFDVNSGTLPSGLSIESSTGVIRGTPSAATTQTVTVRVTDANGATATTNSFAISISAAPLGTPSTPTSSATVGSLKSMGVTWLAVDNASSYTVKIYATNGSTLLQTISSVSGTFLTISSSNFAGIADGTNYKISVTAVGTGNYSSGPESSQSSTTTNVQFTFDPNGGSGSSATQAISTSDPTSLTANSFTRTAHTFREWNTLANGTGTGFPDQQAVTSSTARTLYAIWTSLEDKAWDKGSVDGEYASLNSSADPVIPTSGTAAWTVEAWVRPDTIATGWSSLFAQQDDVNVANSTRNAIWLYSGEIVLVNPGGSSEINTGIVLQANRWTHVSWVMSSSTSQEVYLDGQLVWSGSMSRSTSGTHFAIGGSRQTGHPEFDGQIDQFKVWGTNLSSTQVSRSMHTHGASFVGAPSSSCSTGLRALYDFNEFNSGVVLDRSSCGRHLSFNTGVVGNYSESNFTSSSILETGTANTLLTHFRFNRSYLTAAGGWTPPAGVSNVTALVVGGGGSGGNTYDNQVARGGSGGTTKEQSISVQSPLAITVGQGGQRVFIPSGNTTVSLHNSAGRAGQSSSAGNLESSGGAGGGGRGSATLPTFNTLVSSYRGAIFGLGGASGTITQNSSGSDGAMNSGNGGNGASAMSGSLAGGSRNMGGNGGSGAVILFYGSALTAVDGSVPTITRPGEAFNSTIQINVPLAGTQLTEQVIRVRAVSIATGATQTLTRTGFSNASSYEVTSVNGVATFTGLGLPTNAAFGSYMLEFSNSNFWSKTLTISQAIADSISIIDGSSVTGGSFNSQGVFVASSGTASIGKTALLSVLSTKSSLIEGRTISVSGVGNLRSTSGFDLTLRTLGGADLNLGTDSSRIGSFEVGGRLTLSATNHLHINLAANQTLRGDAGINLLANNFIRGGNASSSTFTTGRIESALGDIVATSSTTRLGDAVQATQGSISIGHPSGGFESTAVLTAGQDISIRADSLELSVVGGLSAPTGVVSLFPNTNTRPINLGTETANQLSLTSAEINRVTAGTLRIGALNGSNSGNIFVTAAIAPTSVSTLALRTSGSVETSGGGSITEVNLAISASSINLPGNNSITGNLALNAAVALSYNQLTGQFTPATVDQITPEYGVATKITMSQVPAGSPVDAMMAVAFNPPPVATLTDAFDNELTSANTQASSYTVTATKASGPGTLTGTKSTTTSTRGVARFTNLSISDSSGVHRVTFTATVTATSAQISGTPSATTGDYNIKVDQTISFTSTAPSSARASGATYTAQATASSGLSVTISVDASASSVCSISSGVVSFLAAGTCVLNANQSGNSTYSAAEQVQQSFAVASAQLDTPAAPTVVATANTLKSLDVSWTAVANAVSYTVKVYAAATGSESAIVVGITETSTRIGISQFSQIADSTLYYVSVTAIASSSERNSAESLKGTATTNSPAVAPTIAFQPTGVNRTVGQSATLSVWATKTDNGVLSYQWLKDGSNISGATSSSLTRNNLAESDAGSYSVVVTNSLNGTTSSTTSRSVSLTVAPALTITTPSTGLSGTVNSAYSLTITAAGGATPRTFSTTSSLPAGVTLTGDRLSGTPTQSGTFPITVTVTDINSATATTSSFNLVIAAAPGLVPTFATPVSSISGSTDRLSVQITNFDASYTYSGTSSIGTVSVNSSGLVVFSGITSGQTATATITTSRTHYQNASASVTATLTPIPIISYNSSDLNSYATNSVVRDLSGRGNNGTAFNTVDVTGPTGSWNFTGGVNGSGDYIDLPDLQTNSFSSGITFDFEADLGSPTSWERVIDFSQGFNSYFDAVNVYRFGLTDTFEIAVFRSGTATTCAPPTGTITSGLNRYTIILNSSSCLVYRNGSLVHSESKNMSLRTGQSLTSNFLGRSNRSNESHFEGQIRSFRIYSGTQNISDIGAINYKAVSYNSNGGSAVTASTTRGTTSGDLFLADAITRAGYTFTGWYDSTNTLTRTKIGDAGARYTPSSDITLAAGWDANQLAVTFNSNSGTLVTSTTTRTGEQLTEPTPPTRAGYTFAGWHTDSNFTQSAVTFPYAHERTGDFTLWAKWTPNPFTVTFDSRSGSAVTAFTTRTAEDLPDSFTTTRPGYTFNGWFVNSDLTGSAITFPYTHERIADFTLHAKWTANDLAVSFNSNGGTAVTSTVTRTDASIASGPTSPTRAGYTFSGWFAKSDLSGSAVGFPYTHGKTENFTLYAKWDAITLNVTFESNGGTLVTSTTVRTDQQILSAPTAPTRAGYTFDGWRNNFARTGNALTFPYTHGETSNIVLYAEWIANVNTITFNSNFPGGSTTTQSITSGVSTALTANPFTRAGYTFAGWSTVDDGTGTSFTNQEVVGVTGSFTLYAKWTANTLNVTFDTKSGSSITTATARTGQQFYTTATTTRAGYTFAGWFDNDGFTGSEVTFPYTHNRTANFTLYAKWTANTLNVTFNTNSGSAVTAVTTRTAESLPTSFTTTRAGYTFLGWFANADFSDSAISFPYAHGRTADFTLHAKWEANTLNVNFVTNSGTAVTATTTRTGEQLATSFTTTRAGYNFLGWFDNSEFSGSAITFPYSHGKTGDFTLYAQWDANTLTATFDSRGGSPVTAATTRTAASIGSAPSPPTRAGYTFLGWFAASDLSGSAISFPYAHGKTENFTLHAKWDANTLNVTFDSNSGSAVTGTTTRTAESIPSGPVSPTRAGYTFAGWYDNPGFNGSQVGFPYVHSKTENFTLFAKWDANTLNVTFDSNSGSAVTGITTRTGVPISSGPTAPTRAGYNFLGWAETADPASSVINFPYAHGKTESFTLYAKWEAKTLSVTFNSSGGSAVSSTSTRTAESILSAPTPPTRAGYNFLGWVEEGDLSSTVVTFPYAHGKTGDFTLFAKWDANSLTVTFDVNGGDAVTATTTRTGEQIAATITATRAGYTFAGWYENSDLSGTVVRFPYAHGKTANFTLYAKWTANTLNVTFDTNSGTAVTATTTRTGESISSAPVAPTRAGYTFSGWFNNAELTGSQATFPYAHGKTANFTLYAKWTPNTLNVRFEINDGSNAVITATTTTGSEVAAPANNPSYPGFEFMGWSATEGGSALTFPYLHGRTTDFTLYAVWKAGTYTVLFQYNGATGGNSVVSTSYTTDIIRTGIALPAPTRTAYTFSGWHSDIALTTPLELKLNGRFVPTVNQTVYAKWTPIDYTVTYNYSNADSGAVPVDSRLYNTGQTVSLLGNSGLLGRTGYTFAGWVTSPSGLGTELNSGQTVSVVSSNINFYPKWTPRTYSISYNLNGGTGSLTGAPVSWTVGTSNVTLPSSGFTRTGYDFGGWSRTPGGSAVSNSFSNNFVDESLTAVWTLKSINYTFAPGAATSQGITRWPANASNTFGSEITLPDLNGEITNIGGSSYLFFGWGDGSATYRSGQKYVLGETAPQFTAQWVKLLDVRYSFGGGTKSSNDVENDNKDAECISGGLCTPNQEITLRDEPTRVGYTFAGWKAQATSETIIRAARTKTVIRDDNYLFFAEWTPIDYNFSFNSLGGSNNHTNRTGNIGRILTLPDPGSRTGYTFGGWTPDAGVTKYAVGPTYVIGSSSVGFEATWVPDVYQIGFDWQGGIGSPQANVSFTVGRGAMTLPAQGDRVKDGYTFAGWSATPGGDVVSNYEPTGNGVLYAKWVDGNYTISFNAQNGPTPVTDVLVQRTSSTTLRTPTRANFRFIGWFDALTGGNFVGAAGATYQPTASKTLYARWVQSSFYGVDEAALETATTYTASSSQGIDTTITHNPSGSQARIQIPAGTLPNGTIVSVRYFKDVTRQRSMIGETNNYFFSVVVSWLLGTGATATVPDTLFDGNNVQKPITVTLSNSQIKAGAMVYQIVDGEYTPLQRATVDGSITVRIYSDPELVVAATPPTAPQNVLVVGPGRGSSTVSWLAPASTGGSPITGYDVLLDGVQVCSAVTVMSCELTNLSDSNTYNVVVRAKNAVGNGTDATTTFTTLAPASSSSGSVPGPVLPVKPVDPPKPTDPVKPAPPKPAPVPSAPAPAPAPSDPAPAPIPPSAAPADPSAPTAPTAPSDPGASGSGSSDGGASIGATGNDSAPPVPFDPLASPEATAALTDTLGNAAAAVGAIAAAAGAAAAAAGAAAGAAGAAAGGGGGSGGSGGSRAPAGGSTGGSGEGGSIATIDTAHERYRNRRRGRGDRWKIWKKKWLTFADSPFIKMIVKTAKFSPLFSKIAVDGAYLRAAFGSFGLLPTVASALIALGAVAVNDTGVAAPHWQWFIVLAVIGIFDAFAGLIGTTLFVVGTIVMHGSLGLDDVRLLLGVIIVGYGPALLANAFRAFRKEPEDGEEYWWERLVDLVVLPFIGGWVTATMISTLPALAGSTLAIANHVDTFGITIAIAITLRVLLEEFVARWFPARLDTLHPTDVDDPAPIQKWISVAFRLSVFIFVTAALMGNVWQVWVGSALFILPTIVGFYSHRFKNFPWIWRVLPTGIPGLAFALIVASLTTSVVGMWFGTSPDLALWSFALLPIPMLALSILGMLGREGNEGEIRWIRRPGFKWIYRIGGVVMLLATMQLAGVIQLI